MNVLLTGVMLGSKLAETFRWLCWLNYVNKNNAHDLNCSYFEIALLDTVGCLELRLYKRRKTSIVWECFLTIKQNLRIYVVCVEIEYINTGSIGIIVPD